MESKPPSSASKWPRVNAYLTPEQIDWINRTRGKYMADTGKSVGSTDVIRIALDELQKRGWPELKRLFDNYARQSRSSE